MIAANFKRRNTVISVSSPVFGGREREYVLDCLSRNWITQGYYVAKFEEAFADMCGVRYAIACSSGTAALHLALLSLGVNSSDTVVVPALTYVATANAARYCGAGVKFIDVNRLDWCIDHKKASQCFASLVGYSVLIPVDLYDALSCGFQNWSGVGIVRDCCHSLGSSAPSRKSILSVFSFYGSKIITCGEGGMIATNSDDLADKIRLYRGQGATIAGRYHHSVVGYNYRMTDIQAAIGLAQLEKLTETLLYRREIVSRYRESLSSDARITLQGGQRASAWVCAVLLPENVDRDGVIQSLAKDGIETRPFFDPLPSLPPYYEPGYRDRYPITYSVSRRGICLPTHCAMSFQDVDYICERLTEAL